MKGTVSLQGLYEKYHDRVEFIVVYIREAHPVDGWWLGGGLTGLLLRMYGSGAATDVSDPKTIQERRSVARQCKGALGYGMRTVVDEMEDGVSKSYAGHPTRLYLVGTDGRVVYAGGLGPFGFKPSELGEAIERYLCG